MKSIGRKWFLILIAIIIIIFFINQEAAIWITLIVLVLFALSYVPALFTSGKMLKFMKQYYMIEDDTISESLGLPIREVREKMYQLSQKKKKWLIVFLNKRYIFYHRETIERFIELYEEGKSQKEILEILKEEEHDLRTRAEIKAIITALKTRNRI